MDLFTYLMAKKGHNTHRDLFSYLLGKNAGGSGTYTTFSGTSLNISNTLQAKIKNIALEGNTSQDGTPTPDTPIPIKVVTGNQNVEIKNSDSTLSQTYPLSLGNIELAKIGNYKDYIFKNVVDSPYYNANLELNEWYLHKEIDKLTLNGVTDKWDRQTASGGYRFRCFTYQSVINSMNNSIGYSNYFKNNGDTNTHNGIFGNGGVIQLRDDNLFTTVTDVTTFLSQHNTIVYYIKKTTANTKITDTTLIQQLENINNNARSYSDTTIIECSSASTDNETIGFSGDIKVTSVGNSLNTSLLSNEEPNLDEIEDIEQNDEPIENEEIEEKVS